MTHRPPPKLLATLLCIAALLGTGGPAHAGWLAGWDCRQEITIQPSVTPGNLTDFPLLVQIKNPANEVFAKAASPTGHDIVFTAVDGTTVLPREIEYYSSGAAKELDAWVRTDLSSSAPTTLYMYYNGGPLPNSTATWDNGFAMVQHLQENPSGAGPQMKDSTAYGNDGTTAGGMTSGQQVMGKVGGALDFDGGDTVNCGSDPSLYPSSITMEAWARADLIQTWDGVITNIKAWGRGINLQMGTAQGIASGISGDYLNAGIAPTTNQWYHLAVTHDDATNSNKLYVNGTLQTAEYPFTRALVHESPFTDTVIGDFYSGGSLKFNGILDEVRISDTARTADWVEASCNNQSNPAAHQAEGAAESQPLGWLEGYTYRQPITLQQGAVPQTAGGQDVTLADFAVPIQLRGANHLFANVNSPDGYDITFTDATGQARLDCEIEVFDKAGDQLTAWVKVPFLPSNQDTTLYMYYGGPYSSGDPSTTATWDDHFRMVQHLQEDPTGTLYDSTSHDNDGTAYGMTSGQQVAGQVGGCLDFVAAADWVNCGDDPSLYPADVTIEAWANLDTMGTYRGIMTNKDDTIGGGQPWDYGINLQMGSTQDIASLVGDGNAYTYVKTLWGPGGADNPETDRWYHIVITHDSATNENRLYVDGKLERVMTRALVYPSPAADTMIGMFYSYGSLKFDGLIDELRISDIARSGEWIIAGYRFQHWPGYGDFVSFGDVQTPEPTTLVLLAGGLLAAAARRRRRTR